MGLSVYNIKKWYLMLTGKSVLHVNQDIGKCFSTKDIKGYYNNLTEKVTILPALLQSDELPLLTIESGEKVEFPVGIFQYGLGSYDLYLQTGEGRYKKKFLQCCQWALSHQETSGAWSNFFYIYPDHPYGAMCQGEGASLFLRGYRETGEPKYLAAARKAIDFMLKSVEDGGCLSITHDDYILLEYTHKAPVLNGWIFALWGLYDILLVCEDAHYANMYHSILETLIRYLPVFDNGYWSLYDTDGAITSPFYHHLHIAQMDALYQLTGQQAFSQYRLKWENDQKNKVRKTRAFVKKALQKILE